MRHKRIPGYDGAKIDEHGAVKKQINDVWEMGCVGFLSEPAISCKAIACSKCYQKVVTAQCAAYTNAEESQQQVKDCKSCTINVSSLVAESQDAIECRANDGADEQPEYTLPEYGEQKIVPYGTTSSPVDQCK